MVHYTKVTILNKENVLKEIVAKSCIELYAGGDGPLIDLEPGSIVNQLIIIT